MGVVRLVGGPRDGETVSEVPARVIEVVEFLGFEGPIDLSEDAVIAEQVKLDPKMGFGDDAYVWADRPKKNWRTHRYKKHGDGTAHYVGATDSQS